MDAIADDLGLDRAEVRARNFIQPDEMPYDHGLIFQDGRPLIYDSGDFPAALDKLKELVGWDDFAALPRRRPRAEGRRVGIGHRLLRRGHRRRPVRGRPRPGRDHRPGQGLHRPDHARARATRRCSRRSSPTSSACRSTDVDVTTGDTRRFGYAVGTFASRAAVMSGNAVALAARKVREPRRCGSPARRWRPTRTTWRSSTASCTSRATPSASIALSARWRCCPTRCATPSTRRPRRPPSSPARRPRPSRRSPRTRSPGWRARDYYSPPRVDVRQRHARRDRRDRPGDRRDHDPALLRRARLRHA